VLDGPGTPFAREVDELVDAADTLLHATGMESATV
jgi:hypothetical protein